ncbi:MAG TPA: transglycosylase SLT domain-containing protein [Pyrinomonadaceae bacterium]|jgi:dsDNA-binding SOS-regulon protein
MGDQLDDILNLYKEPKKANADANPYDDLIEDSASRHDLDPDLIRAMMFQESRNKPRAVSNKNAQGLMQLIPDTAKRFGVTDPFDPRQSIEGGAKYMRWLLDHFDGDVDLALAGYNAGEGAVDKYGRKIPPYRETQDYVKKIRANYKGSGRRVKGFNSLDDVVGAYGAAPQKPVDVNAPDNFESIVANYKTPAPAPPQPVAPVNPQAEMLAQQKNALLFQNKDLNPVSVEYRLNQQKIQALDAEIAKVQAPVVSQPSPTFPQGNAPLQTPVQQPQKPLLEEGLPTTAPRKATFKNDKGDEFEELDDRAGLKENQMRIARVPRVGQKIDSTPHVVEKLSDGTLKTIEQKPKTPAVKQKAPVFRPVNDARAPRAENKDTFSPQSTIDEQPQQLQMPGKVGGGVEGQARPEEFSEIKKTLFYKGARNKFDQKRFVEGEIERLALEAVPNATPEDVAEANKAFALKDDAPTSGEIPDKVNISIKTDFLNKIADARDRRLWAEDKKNEAQKLVGTKGIETIEDAYFAVGLLDYEGLEKARAERRKDDKFRAAYEKERESDAVGYNADELAQGRMTLSEAQEDGRKRAAAEADEILQEYGSFENYYKDRREMWQRIAKNPNTATLEFTKNLTRSVPKAVSSALKSISIASEAIDSTIGGYGALGGALKDDREAKDRGFYQIGKWIDRKTDELLPQDKQLSKAFILNTLPDTLGQLIVQLGAGALTGGAAAPLLIGGASGMAGQYEEADKSPGATRAQKLAAAFVGGLAAVPDAIPFTKWLKPFSNAERAGFISKYLNSLYERLTRTLSLSLPEASTVAGKFAQNMIVGGVFEGGQEVSEDVINNALARMTYDPQRKVLVIDGKTIETFFAGFFGGNAGGIVETIAEDAGAQPENLNEKIRLEAETRLAQMPEVSETKEEAPATSEQPAPTENKPVSPIKRREQVNRLYELGYTDQQIDRIDEAETERIIEQGIAPEMYNEPENVQANASKSDKNAVKPETDDVQAPGNAVQTPIYDIRLEKGEYKGDLIDGLGLIGEGSEHAVYRDGDSVIKIAEPYNDPSGYQQRVDDALAINQILGDGTMQVIGNYKSKNGMLNPIYRTDFVEGRPATPEEIESFMKGKGFTPTGRDNTFEGVVKGKKYTFSDLDSDNVIVQKDGKIAVIDAGVKVENISPSQQNARKSDAQTEISEPAAQADAAVSETENRIETSQADSQHLQPLQRRGFKLEPRPTRNALKVQENLNASEEPVTATPNTEPEKDDTGFKTFFGGMSGDMGESLRKMLWSKVERGETEEVRGAPSNLLIGAKAVRGRGGLQTRAEFDKFALDFTKATDGKKGDDLKAAANAVMQRYAPKTKHEFASTQFNIPKEAADKIQSVSKKLIPDSDLYIDPNDDSYGREDESHITARWGLKDNNPESLRALLAKEKPFTVKLGKVSIFEGKEDTPYDVVKVDVESEDLHRINKLISENSDVKETFPYSPHATLAYVPKGEGQKYVGNTELEGEEIAFNELTFAGKNGERIAIPLGGEASSNAGKASSAGTENKTGKKIKAEPLAQPLYIRTDRRQVRMGKMRSNAATLRKLGFEYKIVGEKTLKITKKPAGLAEGDAQIEFLNALTQSEGDRIARLPERRIFASAERHKLKVFVARAGGIRPDGADLKKGKLSGELRYLSVKEGGMPGLVNKTSGYNAEQMAQKAFDAGFFPEYATYDLFNEAIAPEEFLRLLKDDSHRISVHNDAYTDIDQTIEASERERYAEDGERYMEFYDDERIGDIEFTAENESLIREVAKEYGLSDESINALIAPSVEEPDADVFDETEPDEVSDDDLSFDFAEYDQPATLKSAIETGDQLTLGEFAVPVFENKKLAGEKARVQRETLDRLKADPQNFVDEYYKKHGDQILNADRAKELFDEYEADRLENDTAVHAAASALTRLIFEIRLSELPKNSIVVLSAGGQASGKSTIIDETQADLVYDSLMSNREGNRIVLDKIADAEHRAIVVYVYRPIEKAAVSMLRRLAEMGRPVSEQGIAAGHFNAQQAFLTDTDAYAKSKNFLVEYYETVEGEPARKINLEELRKRAYNSYDEVLQKVERAIDEELQTHDYEDRIKQAYDRNVARRIQPNIDERHHQELQKREDSAAADEEDRSVGPKTLKSAISTEGAAEQNIFFSQLERVVSEKMPNRASAAQVKGIVNNPQTGIKKEEIEWLGLSEFLDTKENFTRAEVLDFIRGNQVEVHEVVKGDEKPVRWNLDPQGFFDAVDSRGTTWELIPRGSKYEVYRDGNGFGGKFFTLDEAKAFVEQQKAADTKYSNYQVDGDKRNYRELLLTMPQKQTKFDRVKIVEDGKNWRVAEFSPTGDFNGYVTPPMKSREEAGIQRERYLREDFGVKTDSQEVFRSQHFDEPNILAHVRFNERTDADGKRVLFLEEVQSDWHQEGRRKGYKGAFPQNVFDAAVKGGMSEKQARADIKFLLEEPLGTEKRPTGEQWGRLIEATRGTDLDLNEIFHDSRDVPDAPFKKSWHELAVKRMLRYAAENGFDRLSWTTGQMQSDRYDLSKEIDKLQYWKNENGKFGFAAQKGGEDLISNDDLSDAELESNFGKDIAEKIINNASPYNPNGTSHRGVLSGIDLKVGGSGMKGFYDKILPSFASKYVKKWGASVGTTDIETENIENNTGERLAAQKWLESHPDLPPSMNPYGARSKTEAVHAVDITPAMRESVLQGQPLFNKLGESIAPEERPTVEAMRELPYVPTYELLNGGRQSVRFNDRIQVDPKGHERFRRLLEESRGDDSTHAEDLFGAVTFLPQGVRDALQTLKSQIEQAKELGYTPEEISYLETDAALLEEAARAGRGTAVVYILPSAIPEELFHQADIAGATRQISDTPDDDIIGFLNSLHVPLERHSKTHAARLDSHAVRDILWQKYFTRFNEYKNLKNKKVRAAILRAEIPPLLLRLSDRELHEFGIAPEMKADYLLTWFEGYAEKNGIDALDNFEKEEINAQEYVQKIKDGNAAGNVGLRERDEENSSVAGIPSAETRAGPKGSEEPVAAYETDRRYKAEILGEKAQGTELSEKRQKKRGVVKTLENKGYVEEDSIAGDAAYYTRISRDETRRAAEREVERLGLADAAAKALQPVEKPSAENNAFRMAVAEILFNQADAALAAGDAASASAKLNQSLEVIETLSKDATAYGQAISQLASWTRSNPATVPLFVQKQRSRIGFKESLTPEQIKLLRDAAEEAQKTLAEKQTIEVKLEKAEAENDYLKDALEISKLDTQDALSEMGRIRSQLAYWKKKAEGETRNRQSTGRQRSHNQKIILENKESILARVAEFFPSVANLKSAIAPKTLKSAIPTADFTQDKREALVRFAAVKILDGTEFDSLIDILMELTEDSDLAESDIRDIHLEAYDMLYPRKTGEAMSEAAKVRAKHSREAAKWLESSRSSNNPKRLSSRALEIINHGQSNGAGDDVITAALYLETHRTLSIDQLSRALRADNPQLGGGEALDLAMKGARLRQRTIENLRQKAKEKSAEKNKLRSESIEAGLRAGSAYRKLNQKVEALSKPKPGYFDRGVGIYKSALVSAFSTSWINLLGGNFARKMHTSTDLLELALNKVLEKLGKENFAEKSISPKTAFSDVLGYTGKVEGSGILQMVKRDMQELAAANRLAWSNEPSAQSMRRSKAQTVLNEFPMEFERLFSAYNSDIEVQREAARRAFKDAGLMEKGDLAADKIFAGAEWFYDRANYLNKLQEFYMRDLEFLRSLQKRVGAKGIKIDSIIEKREWDRLDPVDVARAVDDALKITFAQRPGKDSTAAKALNLLRTAPLLRQAAPFVAPFANFTYNAIDFLGDYAPGYGLLKQSRVNGRENDSSLWDGMKDLNSRDAAKQIVGTVLFLTALGIVRNLGDDDDWKKIRVPGLVSKDGKPLYVDATNWFPFTPFIFMANKFNRLISGKPVFSDKDKMFWEMSEAFLNMSQRNISENTFLQTVQYAFAAARDYDDEKQLERFEHIFKKFTGDTLGAFFRPFKILRDASAAFIDSESEVADLTDSPFLAGLTRNLPAQKLLTGADGKKRVTGEPITVDAPFLRIFGWNIQNPDYNRAVPSKALAKARDLAPDFSGEKDILPEAQRERSVKAQVYQLIREAGTDAAKQKTVENLIGALFKNGQLKEKTADQMKKMLGLTDLQMAVKKLSMDSENDQIGQVLKLATAEEKESLRAIIGEKMKNASVEGKLTDAQKQNLEKEGFRVPGDFPMPEKVKTAFEEFDIKTPNVSESLTVKKGDKRELSPGQYDKYRRETLERIYKEVERTVDLEVYKNGTDERRKELLKKAIARGRGQERAETKNELRRESSNAPRPSPFRSDLAGGSENVEDLRDQTIEEEKKNAFEAKERAERWSGQGQSENVVDLRKSGVLKNYLEALRSGNPLRISIWRQIVKGVEFTKAERREIAEAAERKPPAPRSTR